MHFIVAIGYDDTYIYANDPNNKTVPRKQAQSKFKSCMKQAFLFWPEKQEKAEPTKETESTPIATPAATPTAQTEQPTSVYKGSKIVDLSKYQATIDYDKLLGDTALVILRAGYRGTGGGITEDQKFELHASEMTKRGARFGVYFYSIASNADKGREEARKFVEFASKYNPLFYAIDAEYDTITNAGIAAFVDELRNLGVERVGCYVAHNHYKDYNYDSLRSKFNFTWIPRYGSNNGTVSGATKPSYVCDLWQFTSTGSVNGISGNVDMNVITGDGKPLSWFLDGTESAPVTEPVKVSGTVVIHDGNVNVRTLPNTSGTILGVAFNGDTLPYGGTTAENGWLSVVYNGKNGWVSNKYGRLV